MERSKHGDLMHLLKTLVNLVLQDTKGNEIVLFKGSIRSRIEREGLGSLDRPCLQPERSESSIRPRVSFDDHLFRWKKPIDGRRRVEERDRERDLITGDILNIIERTSRSAPRRVSLE